MGIIDKLRNFFNEPVSNDSGQRRNEWYEKLELANEVISLVHQIERIETFDSILWNLRGESVSDLERKNIEELTQIRSKLKNRLVELTKQKQRRDVTSERLEEAKWTGQKPKGMTDHDFDRLQRDEGR